MNIPPPLHSIRRRNRRYDRGIAEHIVLFNDNHYHRTQLGGLAKL